MSQISLQMSIKTISNQQKIDNSFSRNTGGNFILKVLMLQIAFSNVKLPPQNKREHSKILLRFINDILLSQVIETNLIERGLVKIDPKISKQEIKQNY